MKTNNVTNYCVECGEEKPRADRAQAYKDGDICGWQCSRANSVKKNKSICMEDRYIRESVERRGDDYWEVESVLFELCQRFGYISFLAADQWWGINFKGTWCYDSDATYYIDAGDAPEFDSIEGIWLEDGQTIGWREYTISVEPDSLKDGLIRLLAKCVTQEKEFRDECAAWEKAHATEVLNAARAQRDRRLADPQWAAIQHSAHDQYDTIEKRLSDTTRP